MSLHLRLPAGYPSRDFPEVDIKAPGLTHTTRDELRQGVWTGEGEGERMAGWYGVTCKSCGYVALLSYVLSTPHFMVSPLSISLSYATVLDTIQYVAAIYFRYERLVLAVETSNA